MRSCSLMAARATAVLAMAASTASPEYSEVLVLRGERRLIGQCTGPKHGPDQRRVCRAAVVGRICYVQQPRSGPDSLHGKPVFGQGACFVGSDDVVETQGFDSGQGTDDGVAFRHPGDAEAERHRQHYRK